METIIEFLYRFCSYVMFGFTLEIFFVAISNIADGSIKGRDKYLEGKTYLWMVPIYGFLLTLLFEPMSINLMNYGILTRYIIYGFMITVFEGLTGLIYDKLLGFCPWDYSNSKWKLHPRGYTKVTLIPAWGVAGLIIEKYSELLLYLSPFVSNFYRG